MDYKELWIAEQERLEAEYLDRGMPPKRAHELSCDNAQDAVIDRLADHADFLRKRKREEGY